VTRGAQMQRAHRGHLANATIARGDDSSRGRAGGGARGEEHHPGHNASHAPHGLRGMRATLTPDALCKAILESHVCVEQGCLWCEAWVVALASSTSHSCVHPSALTDDQLHACGVDPVGSHHVPPVFHSLSRGGAEGHSYRNGMAPRSGLTPHHLGAPGADASHGLHDLTVAHPGLAAMVDRCDAGQQLYTKVENLRCGQFCANPSLLGPSLHGAELSSTGCLGKGYGRLQGRMHITVNERPYDALMFTEGDIEGA